MSAWKKFAGPRKKTTENRPRHYFQGDKIQILKKKQDSLKDEDFSYH